MLSFVRRFVTPMDCSTLPGSSVLGISQARILEWVSISSSRGSSNPGIEPASPPPPVLQVVIFFFFLTSETPGKLVKLCKNAPDRLSACVLLGGGRGSKNQEA